MMDAEAALPGFSGRKLEERAYILLPHPADEADDALEERFIAPVDNQVSVSAGIAEAEAASPRLDASSRAAKGSSPE